MRTTQGGDIWPHCSPHPPPYTPPDKKYCIVNAVHNVGIIISVRLCRCYNSGSGTLCTIYLELEKEGKKRFKYQLLIRYGDLT